MESRVQFQSLRYIKCDWNSILKSCFESFEAPIIISNFGKILIPESYKLKNNLNIATPSQNVNICVSELKFIEHEFLNHYGIYYADLPKEYLKKTTDYNNSEYLKICTNIANHSLIQIKRMFDYLFDHLSEREAEGMMLAQHQSIRLAIAECVSYIDLSQNILNHVENISAINTALEYLIKILNIHAELSGGRAILRGNAIEMMFHLRLFQSVFAPVRSLL